MPDRGDIVLNNVQYRIDLQSYRERDVVDFSPRASVPGGAVLHSELMLYQPLMQSDWRHGFGFPWHTDASGYMYSTGDLETRMDGIAMMYTAPTVAETDGYRKRIGIVHQGKLFFGGPDGVCKYDGSAFTAITAATEPATLAMLSNHDYLFASPYNARLRKSQYSGTLSIQPDDNDGQDTYLDESATNTNRDKTSLILGTNSSTKHKSPWLKFPLTSLPAGATVTGVKLRLYALSTMTVGATIKRVLVNAVENQMTWNKYNSATSWNTAGAKGSGTDVAAADLFSGNIVGVINTYVDITLDATEFANVVTTNYGIIIQDTESTANKSLTIGSFYNADKYRRPELIIEFTLSTNWTDTGLDTNAKDFSWLHIHNGYAYAGVRNKNEVHYASEITLSDLDGNATTDTDTIYVGVGNSATIKAITYAGSLYVAKPDGLWQIGDDKIARRVLDYSAEASIDNFRGLALYNGFMVFTVRDEIYQWNGARVTNITPNRLDDTFPYATYGEYNNFVAQGRFLYCTAKTNSGTAYQEDLLSYDGIGWSRLATLTSSGASTVTMLWYEPIYNRLWYQVERVDGTNDGNVTSYIPFQSRSEYPYAQFSTSVAPCLYTSRFDMGFRQVTKSMPSMLIETQNLKATGDGITDFRYITVYYSLDGAAWVEWADVMTNGIVELTLPGGNNTVEFKYLRLKFEFVTGDATQSPILESFVVRFIMRPEVSWGWTMNVIAAKEVEYNGIPGLYTVNQIRSYLQAARDSKSPISFTDPYGTTWKVYLSAMTGIAQERHIARDNPDGTPDIESVVTINLIEAR